MQTYLAAIAIFIALAPVACQSQSGECAGIGHCMANSDHSLFQTNIHRHTMNETVYKETRDCAEFGMCQNDAKNIAAQQSELAKNSKKRGEPTETRVAFDCGSSGSNIKIVSAPKACRDLLEQLKTQTEVLVGSEIYPAMVSVLDPSSMNTKNNDKVSQSGCTVSNAFKASSTPASTCTQNYARISTWAANIKATCFPALKTKCWAAGTAGNRLASSEDDIKSWANFKTFLQTSGVCPVNSWVAPRSTSNSKSLTFPGTMEAAMEVETILAIDGEYQAGKALAFASAGGSSAQFGICLSCDVGISQTAQKKWKQLLKDKSAGFQAANYPSAVDVVPGDYLNTYHAHDGSIWGVGSFLGTDKCTVATTTPMGGMNAMKCGLKTLDMDTVDWTQAAYIMQGSAQAKAFATDFKYFVTNTYGSLLEQRDSVRFVAKTFGASKATITSLGAKGGKYSGFAKMAYAFMDTLGLVPLEMQRKINDELEENEYEGAAQKDEYEWLKTASNIGFGEICPLATTTTTLSAPCTFDSPVANF